MIFRNRLHAGQALAKLLTEKGYTKDYLVLALPRGGVPVAYEVAKELSSHLDVFIVRKLGVPGQEELAMGALGPDGKAFLNQSMVQRIAITPTEIEEIVAREQIELNRRAKKYRKDRGVLELAGEDVLLVDDGLATGMSMRVAVQALRQYHVKSVHVAVPVSSDDALEMIASVADGVTCLSVPKYFFGVGEWYADFSQTSDEEVIDLLGRHPECIHPMSG